MMPDTMGTMGNTQGVNVSKRPRPKKVATTSPRPEPVMICASRACSDTGAALELADATAAIADEAVACGKSMLMTLVTGG